MDGATTASSFDKAALAKAPDVLKGVIDAGDLSGAVTLIWRKGEVVQLSCQGKRDLSTGAPMQRDTLFRIASMTKPITSTAILMLMEAGKLRLDDPITKWAPEFADMKVLKDPHGALDNTVAAARDITIEDLLTHRAGLAYGSPPWARSPMPISALLGTCSTRRWSRTPGWRRLAVCRFRISRAPSSITATPPTSWASSPGASAAATSASC